MPRHFWLFKSEPSTFSLKDLQHSPGKTTVWDGVRNYQARNMLRDAIGVGDGVLFYHSCVQPMAVMGTAKVVRAGYPDPSQFHPQSKYFDPAASADAPRWYSVDIQYEATCAQPVTLAALRQHPELEHMVLLRPGSRLSVTPVSAAEWRVVRRLGAIAMKKA